MDQGLKELRKEIQRYIIRLHIGTSWMLKCLSSLMRNLWWQGYQNGVELCWRDCEYAQRGKAFPAMAGREVNANPIPNMPWTDISGLYRTTEA